MKKFLEKGKKLYWWLIGTFAILYLAVAFVSTLHAITFFQLANTLSLAILLGAAYEIGQAAVLFSILMSQNRNRMLAWGMMFLLTALQITANVYASFKFMDGSGSTDWTYWQRAILFGVQAENNEMYKVIISWISGALLPVVALGMTALVADNIRMANGEKFDEEEENEEEEEVKDNFEEIVEYEAEKRAQEKLEELKKQYQEEIIIPEIHEPIEVNDKKEELLEIVEDEIEKVDEIIEEIPSAILPEKEEVKPIIATKIEDRKPVNKIRGWHFMDEFIDQEHNIFKKGKWIGKNIAKIPTEPKKA